MIMIQQDVTPVYTILNMFQEVLLGVDVEIHFMRKIRYLFYNLKINFLKRFGELCLKCEKPCVNCVSATECTSIDCEY